MELVRTRLAVSSEGQYKGMADCIRNVLKYEGVRAFYRGLTPSLVGPLSLLVQKNRCPSCLAEHSGPALSLGFIRASSTLYGPRLVWHIKQQDCLIFLALIALPILVDSGLTHASGKTGDAQASQDSCTSRSCCMPAPLHTLCFL